MHESAIRELTVAELEQVAGGAKLQFGPWTVWAGDTASGVAFGFGIDGVGAVVLGNSGTACGVLNTDGGSVGGCVSPRL